MTIVESNRPGLPILDEITMSRGSSTIQPWRVVRRPLRQPDDRRVNRIGCNDLSSDIDCTGFFSVRIQNPKGRRHCSRIEVQIETAEKFGESEIGLSIAVVATRIITKGVHFDRRTRSLTTSLRAIRRLGIVILENRESNSIEFGPRQVEIRSWLPTPAEMPVYVLIEDDPIFVGVFRCGVAPIALSRFQPKLSQSFGALRQVVFQEVSSRYFRACQLVCILIPGTMFSNDSQSDGSRRSYGFAIG